MMTSPRLAFRRPAVVDAEAIFARYASSAACTRYLAWPRHRTLDDTLAFIGYCNAQWTRWPAGPLLILDRVDGTLLGSTGLDFETPTRASTGYVLAEDAWGRGIATEACSAMVALARDLGVRKLETFCHPDHVASQRVLGKCGFVRVGERPEMHLFPNLAEGPGMVFAYSQELAPPSSRK